MPNLTSLPCQLLCAVAINLSHEDLENLTATCRDIYNHKELLKEFLDTSNPFARYSLVTKGSNKYFLESVLKAIDSNPLVADNVHSLRIEDWSTEWDDNHPEYDEHDKRNTTPMITRMIIDHVQDHPELWRGFYQIGDQRPLISLLFLRCPNLKKLHITIPADPDCFAENPLCFFASEPATVLGNLECLSIQDCMGESGAGFALLQKFALLPSLRTVVLKNIFVADGSPTGECTDSPKISNATKLTFSGCLLAPQELCNFLKGSPGLKEFQYSFLPLPNSSLIINPFLIWQALLEKSRETLKKLTILNLSSELDNYSFLGPLCPFVNLEELTFTDVLMVDAVSTNKLVFSARLPRSIRKLSIHLTDIEADAENSIWKTTDETSRGMSLCKQLVFNRHTTLPLLREMNFYLDNHVCIEQLRDFQEFSKRRSTLVVNFLPTSKLPPIIASTANFNTTHC